MRSALRAALVAAPFVVGAVSAAPAAAQRPEPLPPVSVTFEDTAIRDVVRFFAAYADRSIVVGRGVDGVVSADIQRQPWDVALAAVLQAQGLVGRELESGIILVEAPGTVAEAPAPMVTRVFRLSYVQAGELQAAVAGMLSQQGTVSVLPGINALVVTDAADVVGRVAALLRS